MSQAAISVDSNVTIRCLDKYNQVIRDTNIHNKATINMVEGLLRFLCGDFNRTHFNSEEEYVTNNEADTYIPSELRLGFVGVKMKDRSTDQPRLTKINYGEMKNPTFDDYRLQNEAKYEELSGIKLKFDSIELTTFDDPNNSMGLLLQIFIPAGKLVGIGSGEDRKYFTDSLVGDSDGWAYYNPSTDEYEAMFTELGLVSGDGTLLARVLFDGLITVNDNGEIIYDIDGAVNNPIIQSDTTSIVVEWRIGIISIGQNDHVVSGANPIPTIESDEVVFTVETVSSDDTII